MENLKIIVDGIIYELQAKGGISRIYNEILPRMCALDSALQIALITQSGPLQQELPQHPCITHRTPPSLQRFLRPRRFWVYHLSSVRKIEQALRLGSGKGKIWHSTYYTMPGRWRGKTVVTVYDMIQERFPNFYNHRHDDLIKKQKKDCLLGADAIICISQATRQDALHFHAVDPAKTHVVHLAHSEVFQVLENARSAYTPPTDKHFLLYVGGRYHYKNFEGFLKVYNGWADKKDVDVVAVGGGEWLQDEKRLLEELRLNEQVHLLGYIDDAELCCLYNQAAALVYPSLSEAMACGCPVVASSIPSTIEVAGDCPIYFELDFLESFTQALQQALSEGRSSPRHAAGLRQASQYSWDKTARQTLDVYQALLK